MKTDTNYLKAITLLVFGFLVMVGCAIMYFLDNRTGVEAFWIALILGGSCMAGGAKLLGVEL